MRSSPEASFLSRMRLYSWSKFCRALTIAMIITSFIEIWSLKTSCWNKTKNSIKSRSSISEPPSSSMKTKSLTRNLELLTISLLKFSPRTMAQSATSGLAVSLLTLLSLVSHLSMEPPIKKSWRRLNLENSLLPIQSGLLSPLELKISLLSFWLLIKTKDLLPPRLWLILGLLKQTSWPLPISKLMLLWTPLPTCKTSMPTPSCNRPLTLSSLLNCLESRRKSPSIRFSELWTSMVTASSPKMKFKKDTSNSLVDLWTMKKSMKCSKRLMQTILEKLTTLSSLWLPWTKRTCSATTSSKPLSKCLIKMAVVLSRQTRLSRSSPSVKTSMKRLLMISLSKLMPTVTERSLSKNSLKWWKRTVELVHDPPITLNQ